MSLLRLSRGLRGVIVITLAGGAACWAATPDDCAGMRKHGHETEAINCYESLGGHLGLSAGKGTGDCSSTTRRMSSFGLR